MLSAINELLVFYKNEKNPEKSMRHITKFVKTEKNEQIKIEMIAAASQALKLAETGKFSDREIIRRIVPELKDIKMNVE